MEYINYQSTYHEIPEEDFVDRGNLAIVKDARNRYFNTDLNKYNGHVVLLNPQEGDFISLGLFWTEENAILFAEAYVKTHSPKAE